MHTHKCQFCGRFWECWDKDCVGVSGQNTELECEDCARDGERDLSEEVQS